MAIIERGRVREDIFRETAPEALSSSGSIDSRLTGVQMSITS